MNTRIKEVRKAKNLTQESFSERIGLKRNSIAQIESGARVPSNQVILSICREFGVNENWLRNGEGEMFRTMSREDELYALFGKFMKCDPSFKHRLISVLLRMDESEWEMLEQKAQELLEEMKKADP